MKRITIILGISHALFIGAAVACYADKLLVGIFLGLVAVFVRMMVPYPRTIAEKGARNILSYIERLGWLILILWLYRVGLGELVDNACAERFSTLPILGIVIVLTISFIKDWMWILQLPKSEIEAFYTKAKPPLSLPASRT